MKQLPIEVLRDIFRLLDTNDQLECLLVCHHWRQIVEEFSLYHTVRLYNEGSVEKLLKKVQETPEIGQKIERMVIDVQEVFIDGSQNQLLSLLSNLKVLQSFGSRGEYDFLKKLAYPWHNTIRHFSEFEGTPITWELLKRNICPNLTSLEMNGSVRDSFPLLKNAPALKQLMIGGDYLSFSEDDNGAYTIDSIDFEDLDYLHANLPQLETLYIRSPLKSIPNYNRTIVPATSVVDLTIEKAFIDDEEVAAPSILNYIRQKYPNLVKLGYHCKVDYNKVEEFNESGWITLIQGLGTQLTKLAVSNPEYEDNILKILDNSYCRINNLQFDLPSQQLYWDLARSQQALYIQKLYLKPEDLDELVWIKELKVLRKLTLDYNISFYKSYIDLNDLVANCPPTLKSLSLKRVNIDADPKYTGPPSNIETLSIELCGTPPYDLDPFIDQNLPKLSKLKLKNSDEPEEIIFNIPSINLSSFRFTSFYRSSSVRVLIHTMCNDEKRRYSPRGLKRPIFLKETLGAFGDLVYTPPRLLPETETVSHFTLICNSLENVNITKSPLKEE